MLDELVRTIGDRLPPSGLTQEELLARPAWTGPHQFVLIDDEHELRPNGLLGKQAATAPLWNLIERGREVGLHVIAARLPGNWAGVSAMSPFLQKMTGSRAPTLFMDNDPQTVKVFGRTSAQQLARVGDCWSPPTGSWKVCWSRARSRQLTAPRVHTDRVFAQPPPQSRSGRTFDAVGQGARCALDAAG